MGPASLLLLLFLAVVPQTGPGEADAFAASRSVTRWSIRDGLPQGDVTGLAQGADGTLWVATFGGVASFDGLSFEGLDEGSRPMARSKRVTALCATRAGDLWIGTEHDGLRLRRAGHVEVVVPDGEIEGAVHALAEDSRGRIWLGTESGALIVDGDLLLAAKGSRGYVVDFAERVPGEMWMATGGGLFVGDVEGCRQLSTDAYTAVGRDADGAVWAAPQYRDEVEVWSSADGPPRVVEVPAHVERFLLAPSGELLMADMWSLRTTDGTVATLLPDDPHGQNVRALVADHEGNLWLGGTKGLYRVGRPALVGVPRSQEHDIAFVCLAPLDGVGRSSALYIGSYHGSDYVFDDGEWRRRDSSVMALNVARDGGLLLFQEEGVVLLRDGVESLVLPTHLALQEDGRIPPVYAIVQTTRGDVWIGDGQGRLVRRRLDAPDELFFDEDLELGGILELYEGRDGRLWVGGFEGLAVLDGDRVVRRWADLSDFGGWDVRAVHEGADGRVWVGTYGGGLACIADDGTLHVVDVHRGLYEDVVSRILEDDFGHLVLLGNRAISRVAYDELVALVEGEIERVQPQVFSSGPGIDEFEGNGGKTCAGFKLQDGVMWFPTQEGLARLDPRVLERSLPAPQARIQSLSVDGELVRLAPTVVVPPGDRDLIFRFTANTFTDSARARFRYRLDGYDDAWNEGGTRREATYTRVPQGRYRFRVVASNRDGVWSEEDTSVQLDLEPFFYETLWFRGLLVFVALAAAGSFVGMRVRATRRRALLLERTVDRRTAELVVARETLELRVEERTRQLREDMAKREALEARLRASERLEAVGRLAGGVAHDFNNYLMVVRADSELALESLSARDAAVRPYLQEILDVSERASGLTHQLLAYSRQQVLEPRPVDVNRAIRSLYDILRRLVREEIDLTLDLGEDVDRIVVDPSLFEQVIMNLIVNAGDAIEGAGSILVRTRPRVVDPRDADGLAAGAYTVISVADSGTGIDEDALERIFDPFFTTKAVGQGTGLGLASVQGIVEQSGGRVKVQSRPGQGSVFDVWLPCAAEDAGRGDEPETPLPEDEKLRGRVLVCEDREDVARLLGAMLRSFGHEVFDLHDPLEALEAVRSSRIEPDLLVTDIVMPGMSGRVLADELLKLRPELRVLYVSGYAQPDAPETVQGRSAFLQKPFGMAVLRERVEELLRHATSPV